MYSYPVFPASRCVIVSAYNIFRQLAGQVCSCQQLCLPALHRPRNPGDACSALLPVSSLSTSSYLYLSSLCLSISLFFFVSLDLFRSILSFSACLTFLCPILTLTHHMCPRTRSCLDCVAASPALLSSEASRSSPKLCRLSSTSDPCSALRSLRPLCHAPFVTPPLWGLTILFSL